MDNGHSLAVETFRAPIFLFQFGLSHHCFEIVAGASIRSKESKLHSCLFAEPSPLRLQPGSDFQSLSDSGTGDQDFGCIKTLTPHPCGGGIMALPFSFYFYWKKGD